MMPDAYFCITSRFNADEEALAVKRRCSKVIGNAIFIALCLGTLSALSLYIFGGYLVTVIASSKSAAAFPFACEYIRIKALTIPMLLVTFSLSGAYRGYKDLMRPLLASTTATLVKMLMDYIFLVVYKMGVSGAAWSDVVSKGTSVSILLFFLVCVPPPPSITLYFPLDLPPPRARNSRPWI
jgi:Na+-driven multidrug efflux pump